MTMDTEKYIENICKNASKSSSNSSAYSSKQKNELLKRLCHNLSMNRESILKHNLKDLKLAKNKGLSNSFIDRMTLNHERIDGIIKCVKAIMKLPDPLYKKTKSIKQANGINLSQMRVPLGTILMIYESRPNVTIDAASLCLKSGNAVILKGGSDTINTNKYLVSLIKNSLSYVKMDKNLVQFIETTDRNTVKKLLKKACYIDIVIPRGGKGLIETIIKESKIPMIKHLDGNCHVYIDKSANPKVAHSVAINSKTQRLGVCNAMETLLIHEKYSVKSVKKILSELENHGIEIRGCQKTKKIFKNTKRAVENDWYEEFLGPVLSVKIVSSADIAISHIRKYGSMHTDSIISTDLKTTEKFLKNVDSSSVMLNTSTRFADGFEYGLGAEIGISTDKLHARGPVGLIGLTSQKYVVSSNGKIK